MDLSIIVVNWNSADYVRCCLASVYQMTRQIRFEVVVIDGGSFDGCGDMLRSEFPQVRFIQCPQNVGFARANNLAARAASGRWLLFLNPDTEVEDAAIDEMLMAADSLPAAGSLGVRLLNSDGTIQTSAVQAFPTVANQVLDADFLRAAFPRASWWGNMALWSQGQEAVRVEGISGACLLTPRAVFDQVGEFTEAYFMYFEDMDYCYKTAKAGFHNYLLPGVTIKHHGGKSSGVAVSRFSSVMMVEAGRRFFLLRRGRIHALAYRLATLVKAFQRLLFLAVAWLLSLTNTARRNRVGAMRKWTWILHWSLGGQTNLIRSFDRPLQTRLTP